MANVREELAKIRPVYETGVLRLLLRDKAKFYVALLRSCFDPLTAELPKETLVFRLGEGLRMLAADGDWQLPEDRDIESVALEVLEELRSEKDRSYAWLADSFDKTERRYVFRLTPRAHRAIEAIASLQPKPSSLSGAQVGSIVMEFREARRRLATGNAEKIRLLKAESARIDREIEALRQEGQPRRLTSEEVADIVNVLVRFLRDIPVDLQELVLRERANGELVAERMQGGNLSVAEILSEYHISYEDAFYESDDGRRFQDTFEALFVDKGKDEIDRSLSAMERSAYFTADNAELLHSVDDAIERMYAGLNHARDQVRKSNIVISRLVRQQTDTRYVSANKQLGRLFVGLSEQADDRKLKLPLPQGRGGFPTLGVSLRTNAVQGAAPELVEARPRTLREEELTAIAAGGGPRVRRVLAAVSERPVMRDGKVDIAASYNALPDELRRECELAGLLGPFADESASTSEWHCLGENGVARVWKTGTLLADAATLKTMGEG